MIDLFSIGLVHGLLMLAAWRLMNRADLDDDAATGTRKPWGNTPDA